MLGAGAVEMSCPIDWDHPLNKGLIGDWSVIPNCGGRGGLKLRDLVRGGRNPNDMTLTSGPTWTGPSVSTNGSSSYVLGGSSIDFGASGTVVYWGSEPTSSAATFPFGAVATGTNAIIQLTYSSGQQLLRQTGGTALMTVNAGTTATTLPLNCHVLTWSPIGSWYYRNGVDMVATLAGAGAACTTSFTLGFPFSIGGRNVRGTVGGFVATKVVGFMCYNRTFTAGEAQAMYSELRRGNPERWRWVSTRVHSNQTVATGNRRRRVLIARAA